MRRIAVTPLLAVLAVACVPQNAEITSGSYVAFLSDGSSLSLEKGLLDPADYPSTYNIDCRDIDGDGLITDEDFESPLRLDDPLDLCGENTEDRTDEGQPVDLYEEILPANETWITQAGFRVVTEELTPWRGEAVMTSEGDLQIAFHHRVPGGQDSRFVMAIDPEFQPTRCVENGDTVEAEALDGEWIENWSQELDYLAGLGEQQFEPYAFAEPYLDSGSQLFFMNAFSYQFNPNETSETWSLPDEWQAGAAQGKFVEEFVFNRSSRYGEPRAYASFESTDVLLFQTTEQDIFYCDMEDGADPNDSPCMETQQERVRDIANETRKELNSFLTPTDADEPIFTFAPISHNNLWRTPDGRSAGLDGWGELHYSWIVFSEGSDLTVGGSAEGAFALLLDASDSATRVLVKGTFDISKIKKDKWVTEDLLESKLEENEVTLCQ